MKPNDIYKISLPNVCEHFPHELEINSKENTTKKSLLQKLNIFKKKNSVTRRDSNYQFQYEQQQKYCQECSQKERFDNRDDMSSSHRYSKSNIFTVPCYEEQEQDLLETTTMADVIRAIEMLNIDKVTAEESQGKSITNSMHRRLGTDHLYRNQNLLLLNKRHSSSHTIRSPTYDVSPIMVNKRKRIYSCVAENMYQHRNNTIRKLSDAGSLRKSFRFIPRFHAPEDSQMSAMKKHRFSIRPVNK